MPRTRGNNGVIGQALKPGSGGGGIIVIQDAATASLAGAWPGSQATNPLYLGPGGYVVTAILTNVLVTNNTFSTNTGGLIGYSNSFVKIYGTGFIANTVVVVNANTVPIANVTYVNPTELRVALPMLANVATVTFNVLNPSENNIDKSQISYSGDFLVVGGGGSGGFQGGGGGAGGYFTANIAFVKGVSYPIVVGSGAPVGTINGTGRSGNTSSFLTYTVLGGGGGAGNDPAAITLNNLNGVPGASGGGGAAGGSTSPVISLGGNGTPGQGFPGGGGCRNIPTRYAGGGGGASAAGATGTTPKSGAGGAGKIFPFTGLGYAGGGGGGSATAICGRRGCANPIGGGGNGGDLNPGIPASCGRGGGGGGGGGPGTAVGGAGGPGTVILVIPTPAYPTVLAPGATVSTPACAPGRTVLTYSAPAAGSGVANSTYTFIA